MELGIEGWTVRKCGGGGGDGGVTEVTEMMEVLYRFITECAE